MGQVKMEWERMDGAEQYAALLDAARKVPGWCQSRKKDGKPAPVGYGEWMRSGIESWQDAVSIVAAGGWTVVPHYIDKAEIEGKPLRFALCCSVMAAAQRHHHFLHPGRKTRCGESVSLDGLVEAGYEPGTTDDYSRVEITDAVRRSCRSGDASIVQSRVFGYSFSEIEAASGISSACARQRVSRLGRRVYAALAD